MNLLSYLATRQKKSTHLLILLGLAVLVLLLPAGMWDLRGPDEGRYAQVAKELLTRHNWFVLTVLGKPYDQKPPLAFWLFAWAIKLSGGGISSWFLRLPSVLAALGTLFTTYVMARRFGGPMAGFLSGLFLFSSLAFLDDAPTVELNMIYTFFTTACMAVWLMNFDLDRLTWPQWGAFWLLLGTAFMVKGPPVAIPVVISALGYTAWRGRSWQPFRAVRFVPGFLLLLAIVGGWLLAQSRAHGAHFVEQQVSGQTVDRFMKGDHGEPIWYYFPRIFTSFMGPWAIVLVAAMVDLWRRRGRNERFTAPLIGWIVFPFVILMLANGKRVPYMLPLLPAACILSGIWADRQLGVHEMTKWFRGIFAAVLWLAAALMVVAGICFFFPGAILRGGKYDAIIDAGKLRPVLWLLTGAAAAALAWAFHRSRHTWAEGFIALALCILALQFLDFASIRPALDPGKSTRMYSRKVSNLLASAGESAIVTLPELAEPEFNVYGNYGVVIARKADLGATTSTLPRVLALKDDEIKKFGAGAEAAGYRKMFRLDVTKKPVQVYLRDKATTESE